MKKNNKQVKTLVHFLLDKSGSMSAVKDATLKGFNAYIDELKQSKENIHFSLTLFDTMSIETPYTDIPVHDIPQLTAHSYRPHGGTPLYDAVVESVEDLHKKIKDQKDTAVVVAIMTDGMENASTKHTRSCLKKLVKKLEKKGNWTFAYMGANQDAWANAESYGIAAGNTMSWQSTDRGTESAFRGVAMASSNYAMYAASAGGGGSGGVKNTKNFFTPEKDEKDEDNKKGGGGGNGIA